jgi:hypothetical protein
VLDHVGRLGGVQRRRLLAQHVLSGIGGALRPLGVQVVRERDIDGVHPGVGEQLVVGAVQADVELRLAQEGGARIAGARKGDELGVLRPQDRRDHDLAADVGRAHDADPNLRHLGPPRSRGPIVAAGRRARVRCFPEADSVSTPTQSRTPWTILGACPKS